MPLFCSDCININKNKAIYCSGCGKLLENYTPSGLLQSGLFLENRYEILEPVKAGGMGAVYKAVDGKLDNICAVKELLPPAYIDPEEKLRITDWFKREAKLLAKLDHSNLPKVIDYFVNSGRYYLVMNFIEGEDLENRLKREGSPGLSEKLVIEWAKEILKVLHYLHTLEPPVIYRDIKPSNIMIHRDGRAILIDFGIANVFYKDSEYKKTAVGTDGYAPAEQCRGRAEPRSDIYALGATMHHLLTGIEPLPFRFKNLRKINSQISEDLEDVVMKALEDDVKDRFSGAEEMLHSLAFQKEERKEKVITIKRSSYKKSGRERWTFSTGGPVFTSPCISENMVYLGSTDNNFYCIDAEKGKIAWRFKTGNYIRCSAAVDGDFVYFGSNDHRLYCLDRKNGKLNWAFKTGSYIRSCPCVKGGRVYFGSWDKNLYCLDSKNGRKLWEFRTEYNIDTSPLVYKDFLYFGSSDKKFYCVDINRREEKWHFETDGKIFSSPAINGEYIYFGSLDRNLYCLHVKTGKKVWKFRTDDRIYSSPFILEDKVYFGSRDNNFYCLNSENGEKIWEFETGDSITTSPSVSDGRVYFGSSDKKFYCLDCNNGQKLWTYKTDGLIRSSPSIVDGYIFFGSNDEKLYCIDNR